MAITAAMVKELRERTGAGMMECKRALVDTQGDIDAAVKALRKKGAARADKKAGRIAAEGVLAVAMTADNHQAAIVEVNCETDFVAKADNFRDFTNKIAGTVLRASPQDLEALSGLALEDTGPSVEELRRELIGTIGENISLRRFRHIKAGVGNSLAYYLHGIHGPRIGVVVEYSGGDNELAHDIAMQIASTRPQCVSRDEVPADIIEREKEIFVAQARASGKPDDIIEKMITGRINKFLNEITLLGQPFVKDTDQSVEKLLKDAGAMVVEFIRYEVGEGLEKRSDDFVSEVMAQAKGG